MKYLLTAVVAMTFIGCDGFKSKHTVTLKPPQIKTEALNRLRNESDTSLMLRARVGKLGNCTLIAVDDNGCETIYIKNVRRFYPSKTRELPVDAITSCSSQFFAAQVRAALNEGLCFREKFGN